MQIDRNEVLKRIKPNDKVLDIGSWEEVFPRANVIIDLNPYETRKIKYRDEPENFTKDTWIYGDVCDTIVWSIFKDKEFDFAICSHILEDVRDPLFICSQLNRVAKAGYIECPSRFRECAKVNKKDPHTGYDHHRWIMDVIDGELSFTPKLYWAHFIDYLGDSRRDYLKAYQFHFTGVFWKGSFSYHERTAKGMLLESMNLMYFYDTYNYINGKFVYEIENGLKSPKIPAGTVIWVDKFCLPIENVKPDILEKYKKKLKVLTAYVN
ncbi:MAG: hypothetical protein FIB08_05925 [Candidatus Methanoperedens sp.]|nr:hypothetical protein [Candidatus Methanoperedens sp.]